MRRVMLGLMAVLLALTLAPVASAEISTEWTAAFGDLGADMGYAVQPTTGGGYIAAGFGTQGNFEHILVVKTDALGQLQWQRTLNFNNYSWSDTYGESVTFAG